MRPTRQTVAIGLLVVFTATMSIVLARPILLVGAILIGAWMLSRQYRFYSALLQVDDSIVVDQSIDAEAMRTNEAIPITLDVSLDRPSELALEVMGGVPVGASTDGQLLVSIEPSETDASKTVSAEWPVAGTHDFTRATVVATDGLFTETIDAGSTPSVTVGARGSRYPNVDAIIDRVALALGTHDTARAGSGIDLLDIREYEPGDMLKRIDWNATARLGTLYVREFEGQTTRGTQLVVDHRASLADGDPAETKLDYLREVALATIDHVSERGDPIGLLTIGNDGVTGQLKTAPLSDQYETVRRRLLALEPTLSNDRTSRRTDDRMEQRRLTDTELRRRIEGLKKTGHSDGFGDVLVPYFQRQLVYESRFDGDPLYSAVKSAIVRQRAPVWMILFTDDRDPAELYRTVRTARRGSNQVLVVLAPTSLFVTQELSDMTAVSRRYAAFEEYRRSLELIDGVDVVEVGPTEQFTTLLSDLRQQYRSEGVV